VEGSLRGFLEEELVHIEDQQILALMVVVPGNVPNVSMLKFDSLIRHCQNREILLVDFEEEYSLLRHEGPFRPVFPGDFQLILNYV